MDTSQVDKCDLVQLSAGVCVVQIQSISWSIPNKDSAVPACLIPPKKIHPPSMPPPTPAVPQRLILLLSPHLLLFCLLCGRQGMLFVGAHRSSRSFGGKEKLRPKWNFPPQKIYDISYIQPYRAKTPSGVTEREKIWRHCCPLCSIKSIIFCTLKRMS